MPLTKSAPLSVAYIPTCLFSGSKGSSAKKRRSDDLFLALPMPPAHHGGTRNWRSLYAWRWCI